MPDLNASSAILAPAKINLALHVVGQRPDGYHLIETLSVFAKFGDRLIVEASPGDTFEISGPYAGLIEVDNRNLVIAARDLLRKKNGDAAAPAVSIHLEKNLPVAAGLGGGSSDAAATLKLLNQCWQLEHSVDQLAIFGKRLGADIPMCLHAGPLIANGIGENIEPVANFPSLSIVLVNPCVAVSTANIFSRLTLKENPPLPPLLQPLSRDVLLDWLSTTRNDLQSPAESGVAEIALACRILERSGALMARMSGSGATCFGIFEGAEAARTAENAIASEHPGWFVTAVETGASA